MEVAIKATRNMIDEKPDMARERILQEGRLFWLLKHENIIPLHGICLEEPNMCLIMEYARGGPLNRILGNGRRIRPVIKNYLQLHLLNVDLRIYGCKSLEIILCKLHRLYALAQA